MGKIAVNILVTGLVIVSILGAAFLYQYYTGGVIHWFGKFDYEKTIVPYLVWIMIGNNIVMIYKLSK